VRWNRKAMMAAAIFSFLLTACGGDGGDDTGPAPTALPQSPGAATASMQNILSSLSVGLRAMNGSDVRGVSFTRSSKQMRTQDLAGAVASFHTALMARRANLIPPSIAAPCAAGGTVDTTTTAAGLTVTFTDCRERFDGNGDGVDDVEVSTDGSISFSATNMDFAQTLKDFRTRTTRIPDNHLLKEVFLDLAVTGTIENFMVCQGAEIPAASTSVINGTFSEKVDENADAVLDGDSRGDFEDFVIAVGVSNFDSRCMPTDFVTSESGMFSFMDNLEGHNALTVSIPSSDPVVITWETVAGGAEVTVNGSYTLTSFCFTGSLTIETMEALFFPISEETELPDCPTSGVIEATGDPTATMTFTATGGMEIDNGSDGTVDETFESCADADICR
jgi:hypothetical protein